MTRQARPLAEHQRAQRIRQTADAARLVAALVAMFAVILAAVLLYGPDPGETRQTEQTTHAQSHGAPLETGLTEDEEYDDGLVLIAGILYDAETLEEA